MAQKVDQSRKQFLRSLTIGLYAGPERKQLTSSIVQFVVVFLLCMLVGSKAELNQYLFAGACALLAFLFQHLWRFMRYIMRVKPQFTKWQQRWIGVLFGFFFILALAIGRFSVETPVTDKETPIVLAEDWEWFTEDQTIEYAIGELHRNNIDPISKPLVRLAMWAGITGEISSMDPPLTADYTCEQVESIYDTTVTWGQIQTNTRPVAGDFDLDNYAGERSYHDETKCTIRLLAASVRNGKWWIWYTYSPSKRPTFQKSGSRS